MALPKEPRQKMINLMYLVLTALLALNVSSEVLNAFRTVNKSLQNATANIEGKNRQMFNSFEDMKRDSARRADAEKWETKAKVARQLGDNMNNYILNLQQMLREEADFNKKKGTYNEESLEASTRLMDVKGEGDKLLTELTKYKKSLLNVLSDKEDSAAFREYSQNLPLDLSMPEVQSTTNNTWTKAYFHMTPSIAAMTILSKFQNDVKNCESQIVEYCLSRVGRVIFTYDKFQVIANSSATYLMPGEPLTINAGIGAYSSKATPTVTVNGATAGRTPDGDYELKTNAESSPGDYSKHIIITYTDPNDGKLKTVTKDIKYTVGSPTGASVSFDAVKVLYIGLDNPVSVSGGGSVGDEKIKFNIDNGSFTKDKPGHYIVRPGKPGKADITLTIDGKVQTFPCRVKTVPDPVAMVGASKGGPMPVNAFKAQQGVRAELENFVFEGVQFTVTGYTIYLQGAGFPEGQFRQVPGNNFSPVRDLIERCRPGTGVTIDEIKVSGPGGGRQLPPIQFNLR